MWDIKLSTQPNAMYYYRADYFNWKVRLYVMVGMCAIVKS